MQVNVASLVKMHGELYLTDHICQPAGGRGCTRHQRRQSGGVNFAHLAGGGNELAVRVDNKNGFGKGIAHQSLNNILELVGFLLVNYPLTTNHLGTPEFPHLSGANSSEYRA